MLEKIWSTYQIWELVMVGFSEQFKIELMKKKSMFSFVFFQLHLEKSSQGDSGEFDAPSSNGDDRCCVLSISYPVIQCTLLVLIDLEWILNLEFCLLKLLIFYQKLLWNIRSRLNSSTVFETVFKYVWLKSSFFVQKASILIKHI